MLLGIAGPPCAGKSAIARLLVERLGFQELTLVSSGSNGYEDGNSDGRAKDAQHQQARFSRGSADDIVDYATSRWREDFVVVGIQNMTQLEVFRRRPFFLLVAVDAPLTQRLARYRARFHAEHDCFPSVQDFLIETDRRMYLVDETAKVMQNADVHILNCFEGISQLWQHLVEVNLISPARLRPSWDIYFMRLSNLASHRSNCMKRRVGAVIARDRRVVATGYNGTPSGTLNCLEGGCSRCNSNASCGTRLDECLCLHAEENALLEAGRERAQGATLYCSSCPCLGCAKKICQSGIVEVVYSRGYGMDDATARLFAQVGVKLRQLASDEVPVSPMMITAAADDNNMPASFLNQKAHMIANDHGRVSGGHENGDLVRKDHDHMNGNPVSNNRISSEINHDHEMNSNSDSARNQEDEEDLESSNETSSGHTKAAPIWSIRGHRQRQDPAENPESLNGMNRNHDSTTKASQNGMNRNHDNTTTQAIQNGNGVHVINSNDINTKMDSELPGWKQRSRYEQWMPKWRHALHSTDATADAVDDDLDEATSPIVLIQRPFKASSGLGDADSAGSPSIPTRESSDNTCIAESTDISDSKGSAGDESDADVPIIKRRLGTGIWF